MSFENEKTTSSWVALTNSHPTSTESIINCCFDYFKFVFPYCNSRNESKECTYTEIFEMYKKNLPGSRDEEIFELIEMDYPGIKPGLKYKITNVVKEEDSDTGVWVLERIKRTLEHWFNLDKYIERSDKSSIGNGRGFKFMQTYTPGIFFTYDGPEMDFVDDEKKIHKYRTCCLELKGEGCRKVEELGVDLLKQLVNVYKIPGCHATRVDFATDVINDDVITFEWLLNKIRSKHFSSSFRKGRILDSFEIKPEELEYGGLTITFGSEESTSKLNIYDKKAERFNRAGVDVLTDTWIRFEVQCFKDKADRASKTLIKNDMMNRFDDYCFGLLFQHIDIKIKENIYNESSFRPGKTKTWPTDPIWEKFVNNAGKVKLVSQAKMEADFTRTKKWYDKAVIPTQTQLDIFYKENPKYKIDTLNMQIDYLEEMDSSQLSIMNQYRKKVMKMNVDLTFDDIEKRKQELVNERNELLKLFAYDE